MISVVFQAAFEIELTLPLTVCTLAELNAYFAARKSQLNQRTLTAVEQVRAYKAMPALPAGIDRKLVNFVSVPLEKQMWGDEFGACVDRFGIPWMVNIGQSQA